MSSGSAVTSPARPKAAELVEQCNYDLACKFPGPAPLETSPSDPTLLDALADVYLQLGNVEAAGMLLDKSAPRVAPDAGAAEVALPRAAAAGRKKPPRATSEASRS